MVPMVEQSRDYTASELAEALRLPQHYIDGWLASGERTGRLELQKNKVGEAVVSGRDFVKYVRTYPTSQRLEQAFQWEAFQRQRERERSYDET